MLEKMNLFLVLTRISNSFAFLTREISWSTLALRVEAWREATVHGQERHRLYPRCGFCQPGANCHHVIVSNLLISPTCFKSSSEDHADLLQLDICRRVDETICSN